MAGLAAGRIRRIDTSLSNRLGDLERALGLNFRNRRLLEQAFVHSSFFNENPGLYKYSNERLEFLGDAVVGLAVAHELFVRFPNIPEGEMTALRGALVSRWALAELAEAYRLGEYLLLGEGEDSTGGRSRQSNLANVFEALVGAVFRDRGYSAARPLVLKAMSDKIDALAASGVSKDPKSRLQELVQSIDKGMPTYEVVARSGPEHRRRFTVQVFVSGVAIGEGEAPRKVDAERQAALQAIKALESHSQ